MSEFDDLRLINNISTFLHRNDILSLYLTEYSNGNWNTIFTLEMVEIKLCHAIAISAFINSKTNKLCAFAILNGQMGDALIEDLIVDSKYRNIGLGTQLINDLLKQHINICSNQKSKNNKSNYCNSITRVLHNTDWTNSSLHSSHSIKVSLYCRRNLAKFYSKFGFQIIRSAQNENEKCYMQITQSLSEQK